MNNKEWIIKEVPQSLFWDDDNDLENMNNREYYFGRTKFNLQEIWLDKDIPIDLKKKTLYHELLHCYRGCYIGFCELNNCDEDFWCDLSANSHDIIHEIVEEYFSPIVNIAKPYILTPEMLEDKNRTITGNIDWGNNYE